MAPEASQGVVVTLFEGDYHYGVGALVNSLYRYGYRGRFYAGYRGELRGWTAQAREENGFLTLRPGEGLEIRFVEIPPGWHLAHIKPSCMEQALERYEPQAASVFYLDPDIVIRYRWSFFEEWATRGVAVCEDIVMHSMSMNHPLRARWREWLGQRGLVANEFANTYLNSGFVGVTRDRKEALSSWHRIISLLGEGGIDLSVFQTRDRGTLVQFPDQEALNMVAMLGLVPFSAIGPEGMDFLPGGFTMSHAAGGTKPWRKRYIRQALGGVPPSLADKAWLQNTASPVPLLSGWNLQRRKIGARIGSAIGRFYGRV